MEPSPQALSPWVIAPVFLCASFSQGLSGFGQAIIWNSGVRLAALILRVHYAESQIVALLTDFFNGKQPVVRNRDEAVASGAATQAAILSGNDSKKHS